MRTPEADSEWLVETSNKQLNFLQHVMTILKPGGRAAVVLPDNCLFADQAGEVFKILGEECDLNTVLRLPRGTFTPYSRGVKANVVFFTTGEPTQNVWIYDARSNVPSRRASRLHCAWRGWLGGNRWRCFSIADVRQRDFKFDSFKWLKDDSIEDADELPPPEELAADAIAELQGAVEDLNAVLVLLENGAVRAPA